MQIIITGAGKSVERGLGTWTDLQDGLFAKLYRSYPTIDPMRVFDYRSVLIRKDTPYYNLFVQEIAQLRLAILKAQADIIHPKKHPYTIWLDNLLLSPKDTYISFNVDYLESKKQATVVRPHGDLEQLICVTCSHIKPFTSQEANEMQLTCQLPIHVGCSSPTGFFRPGILLYGNDPFARQLPDPSTILRTKLSSLTSDDTIQLFVIGLSLHTKEMKQWIQSVLQVLEHKIKQNKLNNYQLIWMNPSPPPSFMLTQFKERVVWKKEYSPTI